ncbi:MAG: hypothetical protein V8S58_03595 [Lachnospiraceae bacterium]
MPSESKHAWVLSGNAGSYGAMIDTCLKDNRNLSFAVVTGCLRIAKESIFTGTNKMERRML